MIDDQNPPPPRLSAALGAWLAAAAAVSTGCSASEGPRDAAGAGGMAVLDHSTVGSAAAAGVGGAPGSAGAAPGGADVTGAGGSLACNGPGARFVTEVVSVSYGAGQDYGRDQMPDIVFGPPRGAGCCGGSLDVVSLGNGGEVVVAFAGNGIADGPGPDFVVFENAFQVGGDPDALFAELATVAVSSDGDEWTEFACTATEPPYGSCAGWHPVFLTGDDGPVDPAASGGDAFDLADVGVAEARYVRITDRSDLEGAAGVFDLDAVAIVNALCP